LKLHFCSFSFNIFLLLQWKPINLDKLVTLTEW
jgi:hypothetical protein